MFHEHVDEFRDTFLEKKKFVFIILNIAFHLMGFEARGERDLEILMVLFLLIFGFLLYNIWRNIDDCSFSF